MQFVAAPFMMAVVGFFAGFVQGGLPTALSYGIGFFIGGFLYRVLRHLIVQNVKNVSPKR
ncbi:hypothetical protein [Pseudalkalibacillus sp. SCS-8]|uniref:hypothetical protein n=1 Tax=Pseudalkalibacillus nanhaiensis TaxID=3115291 RepID=UPI0032DA008B